MKERQHIVASSAVKMAAVCQSVGSSSLTVDFQRSLRVLICCVDFLCLWQKQLMVG